MNQHLTGRWTRKPWWVWVGNSRGSHVCATFRTWVCAAQWALCHPPAPGQALALVRRGERAF